VQTAISLPFLTKRFLPQEGQISLVGLSHEEN